ncbi:MAG: ribonuclease P protein component 1 [Candidatus Diapherotrites archaeon]
MAVKGKGYEINARNLLAHELIGLQAEVIESTDRGRKGIKGRVVDETMNVLVVETVKGEKKVPKKEAGFVFDLEGEKAFVEGALLLARPEDRVKVFVKKFKKAF